MDKEYKIVKKWMRSFIPLIIATIVFVFCFIYERELILYIIMALLFVIFVIMYISANKKILHKDGYSYIQAMTFARYCKKAGIDGSVINENLLNTAKSFEYSESLTKEQIVEMYNLGEGLNKYFQRKN